MDRIFFRLAAAVLAFACPSTTVDAQSRALKVEDVVRLEALGRASISPDEAWAVYERRGRYDDTPRYDLGGRAWWAINDIRLIDLHHPADKPQRLLPTEPLGLLRGPWSPSGAHLVVYRFHDTHYEVGIADPRTRSVDWTGFSADFPTTGAAVEWISDREVALIVRPDGSLPFLLRHYGGSQTVMTEAWDRTRDGRLPSRTVIAASAGVARAETPEPPAILVALDIAQGTRRTLASGRIGDFAVSPDHRSLAILRADEPAPVRADVIVQADSGWRQRLRILDLAGRRPPVDVDGFDVAPNLLSWAPDSRELLVWARRDDAAWSQGNLLQVGRAGAVEVLDRSGLDFGASAEILRGVRGDWLGSAAVVYARSGAAGRSDWHRVSPDHPPETLTAGLDAAPASWATIDGPTGVLVAAGVPLRISIDRPIEDLPAPVGFRPVTVPDGEQTTRARNTPPQRPWIAGLGADGESLVVSDAGTTVRLGPGAGETTRVIAASPHFALTVERAGLEDALSLRGAGLDVRLDEVNADYSDVAAATGRPIRHGDAWGRQTVSYLFMPPGVSARAVKGLIVQVYPGGADSGVWNDPFQLTYGIRPQALAAGGYAVLSPSMPLDSEDAGSWPGLLRSVDAAVDAALASEPGLPADRMVVLGHSFGGYAALALATLPSRYRGFVASSGVSDMFGQWGELTAPTRAMPEDRFMLTLQQGWVEEGQGKLSVPPWKDPSAYIAKSPFLSADRMTRPLLLLTADKDYIPMSQSERMFSALWRLGGDVRLVTYWGEHHARWSPANMLDQYDQIFDFIGKVLDPPAMISAAPAGAPTPEPSPRTPPPG
jgi:dipeptidyl aminopeptidase/acylaminoacyl peptidase